MGGTVHVLLPAAAAHLAGLVRDAGCVPIVDATGGHTPEVPDGAWVRTRPGRPAPGTGPVILAELGAPVPGRPTWVETVEPTIPQGFAGIVLKGREAGGVGGEADGLVLLAQCADRARVIVDAGVGPHGAAAVAALGGAGVLVSDTILGCPDLRLPGDMARRLDVPPAEITRIVNGLRVANAATSPVLRDLLDGKDPWALQDAAWAAGDLRTGLWIAGQGLALARGLADRHGTLAGVLAAYVAAVAAWPDQVRTATAADGRPVGTAQALAARGTAATVGGIVGSGVLWELAAWIGRPVHGGPIDVRVAFGGPIVATAVEIAVVRDRLVENAPQKPAPAPSETPAPGPGPVLAPIPVPECAPDTVFAAASHHGGGAVAIIGMGARFPGAMSVASFWDNIVHGRSAIGPVPTDRWDPALYFDRDPSAPDKTYTAIGGFLTDFVFEPKRFRIPPKVARQIDPVQQITLTCVAEALEDAGLQLDSKSPGKVFDRRRCAVILGNSLGGEIKDEYAKRLAWPEVAKKLVEVPEIASMPDEWRAKLLVDLEKTWKGDLPEIDEDSMPGELSNVIAGRIANAFDLAGANFTVDAACASSMAAMQAAVKGLQDGDFDLALTGGADRSMNVSTYVKFCKIGALSPDHSAPFDASANGFVMGEGCGILVLKRLEDAVRDDDRVYAVIRGIGASSDGKGKGITAPNVAGQLRALERAYEGAGIDPATVDLVECHGTSTVVGDKIEVEALSGFIGAGHRGARGPMRIGSVKSMIGHLKSAAGAASIIKSALALFHGVLPPSINFKGALPGVPFEVIPLKVQDRAEPWPVTPDGVRRAGVSSFGFGGTNFHVVLESWSHQPTSHSVFAGASTVPARPIAPPAPIPVPEVIEIAAAEPVIAVDTFEIVERDWPEGLWTASGADPAQLIETLRAVESGRTARWNPSSPLRMAAAAETVEEMKSQVERAIKVIEKGSNPDMLRARGIHYEDTPADGKLAMLFTGQGSQYVGMGLDLAEHFPIVKETFAEADAILTPILGRSLTSYLTLSEGEDLAVKEDILRQTEYSQPATLAVDVAILRLLGSYNVRPDLVAGHSLGEYAACVAAGIMTYEQSLHAVSARGREMANIRLDDPGKMAGIAASSEVVEEVLADVDGYVIAANKNCPSQTVIAGASDAVDEACERFRARGFTVYPLAVSHAFHSAIVAPASEPLKRVLKRLNLKEPIRPITTNVTSEYYPTGDGAVDAIIDLLGQQISAPVEWTAQIERMYADGARMFVEIGPKRALTGFVVSILKRRPHRALYTNHPKRSGVWSFRDALAGLLVVGQPLYAEPALGIPDLLEAPAPKRATMPAIAADLALHATEALPDVTEGILRIVAKTSGYDVAELDPAFELEADLGIDTVKQAEIFSVVRSTYGIPKDPNFSFAEHKTLRSVIDWATAKMGARRRASVRPTVAAPLPPVPAAPVAPAIPIASAETVAAFLTAAARAGLAGGDPESFARALLPAVQGLLAAAFEAARASMPVAPPAPVVSVVAPRAIGAAPGALAAPAVVCAGASIGLPGGDEVFGPGNFAAILSGENRISNIGDRAKSFLQKRLVRLEKDPQTGEGRFSAVTDASDVIRLAGTRSFFDPSAYGLSEDMVRALDICSQLAMAAGLEALRDAGIPLVRGWRATASGKRAPAGWMLPESLRDRTGVIFASAFPGYDRLVQHLAANGDDGEGRFDRRFLFQVLSMGHAQLAQLIGARGPNTAINAACASTTQAVAIAHDWIRLGRCDRVVIVAADDVTNERLMPWIGSGFLASGAATTKDRVEEAALPFDRRRHGMILGMGAVGFVLERKDACVNRGVTPIAELIATTMANSAYHGSRLDPQHIRDVFVGMIDGVCREQHVTPEQIAESAMFMSHETYTPARGGSAAAEIEALRAAFGPNASKITIANTKGYTGHPMGAGIEDAIAVKALQYGVVPPVANFREPDPDLGDLRISRGERRDLEWAIRLSAGFGSQVALSVWRRVARGDDRVDATVRANWLHTVTGFRHVAEEIGDRTLRAIEASEDLLLPLIPEVSPATNVRLPGEGDRPALREPVPAGEPPVRGAKASPAPEKVQDTGSGVDPASVETALIGVVAVKTGYSHDEIDPEFELERDLGIDTVKQAEIFSEIREKYGIERDDGFRLNEYPTIRALAGWLANKAKATSAPSPAPAAPAPSKPAPVAVQPAPVAARPAAAPAPAAPPAPIVAPQPAPAMPAGADGVLAELIALVAQKTGYSTDELDPDFELERDLGVDTVKQAEIVTDLRGRYGIARDDAFRLSDFPSLRGLAMALAARIGTATVESTVEAAPAPVVPPPEPEPAPNVAAPEPSPAMAGSETPVATDDLANAAREAASASQRTATAQRRRSLVGAVRDSRVIAPAPVAEVAPAPIVEVAPVAEIAPAVVSAEPTPAPTGLASVEPSLAAIPLDIDAEIDAPVHWEALFPADDPTDAPMPLATRRDTGPVTSEEELPSSPVPLPWMTATAEPVVPSAPVEAPIDAHEPAEARRAARTSRQPRSGRGPRRRGGRDGRPRGRERGAVPRPIPRAGGFRGQRRRSRGQRRRSRGHRRRSRGHAARSGRPRRRTHRLRGRGHRPRVRTRGRSGRRHREASGDPVRDPRAARPVPRRRVQAVRVQVGARARRCARGANRGPGRDPHGAPEAGRRRARAGRARAGRLRQGRGRVRRGARDGRRGVRPVAVVRRGGVQDAPAAARVPVAPAGAGGSPARARRAARRPAGAGVRQRSSRSRRAKRDPRPRRAARWAVRCGDRRR